jgi:hypothetical protein
VENSAPSGPPSEVSAMRTTPLPWSRADCSNRRNSCSVLGVTLSSPTGNSMSCSL